MNEEHHFPVTKTARYFSRGTAGPETKCVWIVLHGYGLLANYFLNWFEALDEEQHYVVAPEGPHRFYTKGFSGRVGASWMTKEDRETDIKDYIHLLDQLYADIMPRFDENVKVIVIGFSQGAATLSRWICAGNSKANHFVLWSGVFPPDVSLRVNATIMNKMKNWLICGDADEFINEERFAEQVELFRKDEIEHEVMRFEGGHKVEKTPLLALAEKIIL